MRTRFILISSILAAGFLCLLALVVYNLPPVHDRLSWRVESLITQVRHTLRPPEQAVFVPQAMVDEIVFATLTALAPTPVPTLTPTQPGPTPTPTLTPLPTLTPTAVPGQVTLSGVIHEYQKFNNCGPANVSMALSFWDWSGDQFVTRDYLRPSHEEIDDKNVMPSEMVDFVESQTDFKALVRYGGDLALLKRLVAAGFPVIIEEGFELPKEDWMGHYALVTGYDDERAHLITQDSYIMADYPVKYEDVTARWRDFNSVYVVIYPPEREAELFSVLGPQVDPLVNYQTAAELARQDITVLSGRDLFFAYYNLGTSLVGLEDWAGAAQAYDQAFALYPSIPEADRPWRMLWYQVGPYPSYFYTGRYQDVINLAESTLSPLAKPGLEETFYWRGLAREALGDIEGALADFEHARDLNPNFLAPGDALQRLAGRN